MEKKRGGKDAKVRETGEDRRFRLIPCRKLFSLLLLFTMEDLFDCYMYYK